MERPRGVAEEQGFGERSVTEWKPEGGLLEICPKTASLFGKRSTLKVGDSCRKIYGEDWTASRFSTFLRICG